MLHCKILDASPNQHTVIHAVDDAIRTLDTDRDNFVFLLTYVARYMTAAGRVVNQIYPRLFHITCVARGSQNAAERIRAYYEDVDKLISSVKASVVKNKDRRAKFSEINSCPQPVVTRWKSWLKATEYCAKKFPQVCEIVNAFKGTEQLVAKARKQQRLKAFLEAQEKFTNVISNLLMKYKEQRAQNILLLELMKKLIH